MPTPKADLMELHLGVFQNRINRLRGKMQSVAAKMNMDSDKVEGGIDKPALEAEFNKYNDEYKIIEGNLIDYENKVLLLTELE